MNTHWIAAPVRAGLHAALAVALLLAVASAPARAQDPRGLVNLLVPGGYFLTSNAARDALGSPKFYAEADLMGRSVDVGVAGVSASLKVISATSHYFPFTRGSRFELLGPSVRVSTFRVGGGIRPFATGGLFAGHVRSERRGIDRWGFAPGVGVGVEIPVARVVSLTAQYRLNRRLGGVDTSGFAVSLRIF